MQLQAHALIKDALRTTIRFLWELEVGDVVLNQTPKIELGELATPVCFELAKKLKKAPRAVAEELIRSMGDIPGVHKIELAGAGYINFFFDRAVVMRDTFDELVTRRRLGTVSQDNGKVVVEHTNINPNKAAHIGHLRNAAIGDTFVRILKACGRHVEVQNYIDNTGVQVADVIVGFRVPRKKVPGRRAAADRRQIRSSSTITAGICTRGSAHSMKPKIPSHALRGEDTEGD